MRRLLNLDQQAEQNLRFSQDFCLLLSASVAPSWYHTSRKVPRITVGSKRINVLSLHENWQFGPMPADDPARCARHPEFAAGTPIFLNYCSSSWKATNLLAVTILTLKGRHVGSGSRRCVCHGQPVCKHLIRLGFRPFCPVRERFLDFCLNVIICHHSGGPCTLGFA